MDSDEVLSERDFNQWRDHPRPGDVSNPTLWKCAWQRVPVLENNSGTLGSKLPHIQHLVEINEA